MRKWKFILLGVTVMVLFGVVNVGGSKVEAGSAKQVMYRVRRKGNNHYDAYKHDGGVVGTTGKSTAITGFEGRSVIPGVKLQYRVYERNVGWGKHWTNEGKSIETKNQIEAIQFHITSTKSDSETFKRYKVVACAHMQSWGWDPRYTWPDGQARTRIGSAVNGKRLEAFKLQIIPK